MDADLYVPGDGWLHRTDPRVKFLISIVMLALCLVWRNWAFILGILILEHVMLATDRVPAERIGWVWKILAVLIVFIVVLWPVFDQEWNARALAVGMVASHAGEPAHGGGDGSAHSSARLCMFHHAVHPPARPNWFVALPRSVCPTRPGLPWQPHYGIFPCSFPSSNPCPKRSVREGLI